MASFSPPAERVTVTMPAELVASIDRIERNRSRFIAEAVRHELQRRQRLELQRSLQSPHPDSLATAALGLADWAEAQSDADNDLLDPKAGSPLAWQPNTGWANPETPASQP
ncbi:MAG: CopG family ribbon-helix-helix protein [Synechococcaceae cyanobacterium]